MQAFLPRTWRLAVKGMGAEAPLTVRMVCGSLRSSAGDNSKTFQERLQGSKMADNDTHIPKGYKRGRWAGKLVTLRKAHFEVIQEWAKKSGMSQASFYRAALMRGALELAKGLGFADTYPEASE